METKKTNNKVVNWEYLTEFYIICQYLNRADFIELSATCKHIRSKLKFIVFKRLSLIDYYYILPNRERYKSLSRRKALDVVLELLEADLGNNLQSVREVAFHDSFNNRFSKQLVVLIPNITTLKFYYPCYQATKLSLATILNGLIHLKQVEFWIYAKYAFNSNTDNKIFPTSLNSIKVNAKQDIPEILPIFDEIDSNYTNLNCVSITSNKILANLSCEMPNLKEVDILNYWDLDNTIFLKFIRKNPQLTKIEVKFNIFNVEICNIALSSRFLVYLSIDNDIITEIETNNFSANYSIKHLNIGKHISDMVALKLINTCHNLKMLEFIKRNFANESSIHWDKLDRSINTLQFVNCFISNQNLETLDSLNLFKKINFIGTIAIYNSTGWLKFENLKNYRLIRSSYEYPSNVTIIKL